MSEPTDAPGDNAARGTPPSSTSSGIPPPSPSDAALPPDIPASVPAEIAARLGEETRARLAAIIESSDDAIVSKTLDGIVRTWNKGAERIFGYTAQEMIGRPIQTIVPKNRAAEEPDILRRLARGERVDHFETVRVRKDGRQIEVSVTISPIRDASGQIIGASKIARDITGQKDFQRQLQQAKEIAEAASRAKDHFLRTLSHELRTPLTPVLAALSLMEQRSNLSEEMRGEINMIRRNVEVEARLVDDLLDLTRISRGKIRLHFEAVDAHAIIRNTLAMFQNEMDDKGLEASVALRARDHHVWADPGRLQQIFLNLLSNAVKFTPERGAVSFRSSNTDRGNLVVEIRDTGVGIDADFLARLFDPFEQGEQTKVHQFGGLGLGLAITRSLVEMHSGTIRAASEGRGKGAVFTVEFSTVPSERARTPLLPIERKELTALRVLLLEDHEDTRMVMTRLLGSLGCSVTAAGTVRDALALAENTSFDLLVSDIGLPDGSGTEVMQKLRARDGTRGIALSGFGQPEDLRRSEEAGFDTHLTKPVDFKRLQQVIQQVAG